MAKQDDNAPAAPSSRLYFTGGHVLARNRVYVIGQLPALDPDEGEHTRMVRWEGDKWTHFDLDMAVSSVAGTMDAPSTVICLGKRGRLHVRQVGRGNFEEVIAEAGTGPGKLGYLNRVRYFDGVFHVVGFAGQIYRRTPRGWEHFDEGVIDRAPATAQTLSLYDIHGTGPSDIYAVGGKGAVFHWNGSDWTRLAPATNYDLLQVLCVSPGEVYVAGAHGVFLRGNRDGWQDLSSSAIEDDINGIETFRGRVYAATAEHGPLVLKGDVLSPASKLRPAIDGNRLHANDGVLWSFGIDDLAYLDDKTWTRMQHPDNARSVRSRLRAPR